MSSTLEQPVRSIGSGGPAVVIGGQGADVAWLSLRPHHGRVPASVLLGQTGGPLFVEPYSAEDLPVIAERASGVVVGSSWMQDFALVRAVARLGLPVIVQRSAGATLEEWLGAASFVEGEGNPHVILCESRALDLSLVRAVGDRPVIADISGNVALAAAVIAAGADGVLLASDASAADVRIAREAVTLIGALLRPEAPATLAECRGAIDRVDAALATLLERRAELAGVVQTLKPVGGFAGRDMERERHLVATMARRAPALGEVRLAPIMNAVIEAGLHLAEERRCASDGQAQP